MTQKVSTSPNPTSLSTINWSKWLLKSPVLAAFVGCIPTVCTLVQSFITGVPFERVADAIEQNRLWIKNVEYLRLAEEHNFITGQNAKIRVTVSSTGDILVIKEPNSLKPVYRWIGYDNIPQNTLINLLTSKAIATEPHQSPQQVKQNESTVICTKSLSNGRLLQRVKQANGKCFDEIINTFTGTVISRTEGSCNSNCE